jgi:hypothetical protein
VIVAALFVQTGGVYFGMPDVDPWDVTRDARLYAGPHPVVAHPPCARWCQLARLVEHCYGHKVGEDEGCFASALESVRKWGGVLEHPAETLAWERFALRTPNRPGGWLPTREGGYVCHVEQGHYGHPARKATWLYAFGVPHLPALIWGRCSTSTAMVSTLDKKNYPQRTRVTKSAASRSPEPFSRILVSMAASANKKEPR